MTKVMLVANRATSIKKEKDFHYIGVDGGALLLSEQNITMDYAIGDFDSVGEKRRAELEKITTIEQLPVRKNESDSEYAIKFVLERYDEVYITGVSGGRLDHFLSVYHMLAFQEYHFTIVDEQNHISKLEQGTHHIQKHKKYLSLFAVCESEITITGVEYPLYDRKLNLHDIYTLSNEIVDTEAILEIKKGTLIVIQSADKKNTLD